MINRSNNSKRTERPRRIRFEGRRLIRFGLTALIVLIISVAIGLFVLTRSGVLGSIIAPRLAERLGGEVSIGGAYIEGSNRLVLRDVVLSAPAGAGLPREAATLLEAKTIIVEASVSALLSGSSTDIVITLRDAIIRFSEDSLRSGEFSFLALQPMTSDQRSDGLLVINLERGTLETGEHDSSGYRSAGSIVLGGTFYTNPEDRSWLHFELRETDPSGNPLRRPIAQDTRPGGSTAIGSPGTQAAGLSLRGRFNSLTLAAEGHVEGLRFEPRLRAMAPSIVARWWDSLELDGQVRTAIIEFDPAASSGMDLRVRLDIEDVGLTIPFLSEGVWGRYDGERSIESEGRPRVRADQGRIELREDRILLQNLRGELTSSAADVSIAGVPYWVNGTIGPLPEDAWAQRDHWVDAVLEFAPASLLLEMRGFNFDAGMASAAPESAPLAPEDDGRPSHTVEHLQPDLESPATSPSSPVVELPVAITRILEQFQLRGCTLDSSVVIRRGPAVSGPDGALQPSPLETSGKATLRDGRGAYARFPYPLQNVHARLDFTDSRLDIVSLLGEGLEGGEVSIGGWVAPLTGSPAVNLRISGQGVPLDSVLREAMSEQFQGVFESLLHEPALEHFRAAGVLPDDADRARMHQEALELIESRRRIRNEIKSGLASEVELTDQLNLIDRRLASLERSMSRPDFRLGGEVGFELDVSRAEGVDQPTHTEGTIVVDHAGILFNRFPYPIRIEGGTIHLEPGRAVIRNMLGTTIGGGHIVISGTVETTRQIDGRRIVRPHIEIGIVDDLMNPALLSAVELAGDAGRQGENPGTLATATRLLDAAGIEGLLTYGGTISIDDENRPQWDVAVRLSDGRANPSPAMVDAMREIGFIWPEGLSFNNVAGTFGVQRDRITIEQLEGTRGDGSVLATGVISTGPSDDAQTELHIRFEDLALEEYLLNLIPEGDLAAARELWNRYQPEGRFNARLHYQRTDGDSPHSLDMTIAPSRVMLSVAGKTVEVRAVSRRSDVETRDQGIEEAASAARLSLRADGFDISGLRLQLHSEHGYDGTVAIDAGYRRADDHDDPLIRISGEVIDGRFESPWINEVLAVLETRVDQTLLDQLNPRGVFDATFDVTIAGGTQRRPMSTGRRGARDSIDPVLVIRPKELTVDYNDTEIHASFTDGSELHLLSAPDDARASGLSRIELRNFAGRFAEGGAFAIVGDVELGELVQGDLTLSYRGRELEPAVLVLLPADARRAIEAIKGSVNGLIEISSARMSFEKLSVDDGSPARWRRDFRGPVRVSGGAFDVGVQLDDVDATMMIEASRSGDSPAMFQLEFDGSRLLVEGRMVEGVTGSVRLDADGRRLLLREVRGECYGGVITAEATAEIGAGGRYEFEINLVGVDLREFSGARRPISAARSSDDFGGQAAATRRRRSGEEGAIFGTIALEGRYGESAARRGRGSMRIVDGRLAANPITLPLLQITQLMLPLDASLSYGEALFYVHGDQIVFEQVLFESDRILLFGDGVMRLSDYHVDMRLRSRGQVVGLSELVGGLHDQIFAIRVEGPLERTSARLIPLPALGGFYDPEWIERRKERAAPVGGQRTEAGAR